MTEKVLAIIGGGRWGQVLLSVIANMHVPFDRIVMVSQANTLEVTKKITELTFLSSIPVEVLPTLECLLKQYDVNAAIIVNAAHQHFTTAHTLIQHGAHVLIEKPIVPTLEQMQILMTEARHHHVVIIPGLSYRFCSYLTNFSKQVANSGPIRGFTLTWSDAKNETRYGQIKKPDASISIVEDVMSHVWTILTVVFQCLKVSILSCTQDNDHASLSVSVNNIQGRITLERDGEKRQRHLGLTTESNALTLDFTVEPGVMTVNGKQLSGDEQWHKLPSPLTRQLQYFFSMLNMSEPIERDLQCCVESVACIPTTNNLLYSHEKFDEPYDSSSSTLH